MKRLIFVLVLLGGLFMVYRDKIDSAISEDGELLEAAEEELAKEDVE